MPVSGHELGGRLIQALGLPKNTRSFSLHCAVDAAVTIECEYYPDPDRTTDTVLAEYELVERPAPDPERSLPALWLGLSQKVIEALRAEARAIGHPAPDLYAWAKTKRAGA